MFWECVCLLGFCFVVSFSLSSLVMLYLSSFSCSFRVSFFNVSFIVVVLFFGVVLCSSFVFLQLLSFSMLLSVSSFLGSFVLSFFGDFSYFAVVVFVEDRTSEGKYVWNSRLVRGEEKDVVLFSFGWYCSGFVVVLICSSVSISCLTVFVRFISSFRRRFLTVCVFVVVCLVVFGDMEFGALRGTSRDLRVGEEDLERRRRGGVLSSSRDFSLDNFLRFIAAFSWCTRVV